MIRIAHEKIATAENHPHRKPEPEHISIQIPRYGIWLYHNVITVFKDNH
jgi:hypothetical protein